MIGELYASVSGLVALDATGDVHVFTPDTPVEIQRVGVIVGATMADGATVKVDKRPTANSDTGRGDGDVSVMTIPVTAPGKGVYRDLASRVKLLPGQQAVVEVTEASGATGDGYVFIQYRRLGFQDHDVKDQMTELTA